MSHGCLPDLDLLAPLTAEPIAPVELTVRPLPLPALPTPRTAHTEIHATVASTADRLAHPDSPVGRLNARLAADPQASSPLRQLEARLGRPLLDLTTCTDRELFTLTEALLVEKHRRDSYWHGVA